MSRQLPSSKLGWLLVSSVAVLGGESCRAAAEVETIYAKNFEQAKRIAVDKIMPKIEKDRLVVVRAFDIEGGGVDKGIRVELQRRFDAAKTNAKIVSSEGDVEIKGNLNLWKKDKTRPKPTGVQLQTIVKHAGEEPMSFNINVENENDVSLIKSGELYKPPGRPAGQYFPPQSGDPSPRSELSVDAMQRIRPNSSSPYGVQLFVKGERGPKQALVESEFSGKVNLKKKDKFTLRVFNDSEYMAGVGLTIDGVSRHALNIDTNYHTAVDVIPPRSYIDIPGWSRDQNSAFEFVVNDMDDTVAARLGLNSNPDISIIKVTFSAVWREGEKIPPNEPSKSALNSGVGIGAGDIVPAPSEMKKDLVVGRVRAAIKIAYDGEGQDAPVH